LLSFSLGISSLAAVEPIEDIHGNVVFVYTMEEHKNVGLAIEELNQWRESWPQFQFNYNTVLDNHDIWKSQYSDEADENYDLRVQRNVMIGITGVTLTSIIVSFLFEYMGN
jgi:hypothetical protein